MISEEPSSFGC